jgi:hypothetical protein
MSSSPHSVSDRVAAAIGRDARRFVARHRTMPTIVDAATRIPIGLNRSV